MALLQLLFFLLFGNADFGAVVYPMGKRYSSLSYHCSGYEWRNDWTPGIPQGQCVNQIRKVHHSYTFKYEWLVPSACVPLTQKRTMCEYSVLFIPYHIIEHALNNRNRGTPRNKVSLLIGLGLEDGG